MFHGDHDKTVHPVNGDHVIAQSKDMLEAEDESVRNEVEAHRLETGKKESTLDDLLQNHQSADRQTLHERAVKMQE